MKTAFTKILTALFAFSIGIGAFLCWNTMLANESQVETLKKLAVEPIPTQILACELMDEPNRFDGSLVSFQATAYVIYDGTIILFPENCYTHTDNFIFVKLELESYSGAYNNLKTLLEGKNRDSRDDFKEVDIRITGSAKITYDAKGYKYYSISPSNIELISPFRKFEPKGAA